MEAVNPGSIARIVRIVRIVRGLLLGIVVSRLGYLQGPGVDVKSLGNPA